MVNDLFSTLSTKQKEILNFDDGTVAVKACPGSGKTFSVAARISRLLKERQFHRKGIAALSFTNVACDEIAAMLKQKFNINSFGGYPHFLGTIDSFINQFIFLPFGNLVMKCDDRPELVGPPYSHWTIGKGERKYITQYGRAVCVFANPDEYFDSTTFDINDRLTPIVPYQTFHFSWMKYYNKNGSVFKPIQDIIDSKNKFFRLGFANQSDANYHSLTVLERYPLIAENIAHQFEYFVIDEAQDTDEIQMCIVEKLIEKGLKNIMLVGDRDQSIFEWNNAKPELFDQKYEDWKKIELIENRRSSQNICNTIQPLSSFQRILAVGEDVAKYDYLPEVRGFRWPASSKKGKVVSEEQSKASFLPILQYFFACCEQHGIIINKSNVGVLYRGNANAKYIDIKRDVYEFDKIPWRSENFHVKDIVRGKLLYENGDFNEGYQLLEKGYFEAINKSTDPRFYCSTSYIRQQVAKVGLLSHRANVFEFIECLPQTTDKALNTWINESNQKLLEKNIGIKLTIRQLYADILIRELFAGDLKANDVHPFYFGTIHSAKGKTFEAVLLILGKKPGNSSYYKTMLENGPKEGEDEELRNVYVAISRPRRILLMAVPEEDVSVWKKKLKIRG